MFSENMVYSTVKSKKGVFWAVFFFFFAMVVLVSFKTINARQQAARMFRSGV
jgi:hypothetical protein